jgi:hypothetical protein
MPKKEISSWCTIFLFAMPRHAEEAAAELASLSPNERNAKALEAFIKTKRVAHAQGKVCNAIEQTNKIIEPPIYIAFKITFPSTRILPFFFFS